MRRKIARRKRKEILKKGAEIVSEYWVTEPDWKRKDRGFVVVVNYCGWNIHAPGYDELAAYKSALECFPSCEEEPFIRS